MWYVFLFQVSLDGNVATTTVIFIPEVKDQDKILYCKAKNLHLSMKTVEDQWKIKVTCKYLCNWWCLIWWQNREGHVFDYVPPWHIKRLYVSFVQKTLTFLMITDPPRVELSLTNAGPGNVVKVGDTVYLQCNVLSNPPVEKVYWKFQVYIHSYCDGNAHIPMQINDINMS